MEQELMKILKAISDENRLRIMNLLRNGELCVCEIESVLNLNQSNASRHLGKLTDANIINSYKKAQYVYFALNKESLENHEFLSKLLEELDTMEKYKRDMEILNLFKEKGIGCKELERK